MTRKSPSDYQSNSGSLEDLKELLKTSEHNYQMLFENTPLGLQSLDKNGNFVDVNPVWLNTLGYTYEEVIGKWFGDFLTPGYVDHFRVNFPRFLAAGEIHGVEFDMVRKDGTIISVSFDGKIGNDEKGQFKQTFCILADVTETKKSALLVKEEHEKLAVIFEAVPIGLMILDQHKRIQMVNKIGSEILGYSSPEELYLSHCPMTHCSSEAGICPILDQNEKTLHRECTLVQKSGAEIPIIQNAVPINIGNQPMVLETFLDIRERKNAMEQLFESRRQFSTLLDNLPGMVYRCRNDKDWTMEFISDGCFEMTGYNPDQLVRNKLLSYNSLLLTEDVDRIWNEVQAGLQTRAPYMLEYRIKTADKKIKWVWEKAKGIFNEKGELLYIEGFISDITDQKYAELIQKVLFEISKTLYTAESVDDVFQSVHSTLKQIIDVENFYIAIYDKKSDTISLPYQVDTKDKYETFPAGKTITGYVIKTRAPLLINEHQISELAKQGHIDIIGTPSKVWLGVPLIVEQEVIGVIAVQSYTDPDQYTFRELEILKFVADQIAIVISRKRTEELFQKEKGYLDQLFEGSPEAIILIDLNGIVNKINSEFTTLFGFSSEDIVGKAIDDFITDFSKKEEAIGVTQGLSTGKVASMETQRRHKNGQWIDVSLLVTPILIHGKIVGGYGIYRDITDRKRIEKNLIAAKEKAEESDKLKSAFLSNMSHEIRTPMNAILGFSTLLSDPGVSDDERSEFIRIIKERGNDLMRIIDDIIDVAKIESGQIKVEIKEVQINTLMTNLVVTLNEVKRKTAKTQIALNCLPGNSDKDFTILTDGNRLRQILTNLIENALKFTHEGCVEFGYTFKKIDEEPFIEFFVRDTGIGIPKEMHDLIFERFRQVDDTNTRIYGGTGLGLTISKNLVRLLGGKIILESEQGKGATFKVTLPLQIIPGKSYEQKTTKTIGTSGYDWSKNRILIVEDEESNFFLMDRILKNTHVNISWAKNGLDAVEMCKKQAVDIVLMDIRMPIMDGYEATSLIKKDHPNLPIIAQTAYALKGEAEKSLAAGCNNYIAKPIDAKTLLILLAKYLDR